MRTIPHTSSDRDVRTPTRPAGRALLAITTAALIGLGVAGCGDDNPDPLAVIPISAHLEFCVTANNCTPTSPVTADPVVFIERVPETLMNESDEIVPLRVMLRTNTPYLVDSINLEFKFDPGMAQVLTLFDGAATLLGACNGPNPCDPQCYINCPACNTSGDLVIGISRKSQSGCTSYTTMPGTAGESILTLGFVAATLGSSPIELVDLPALTGDCEILHWEPGGTDPPITQHPIPCVAGGATLTASRQ